MLHLAALLLVFLWLALGVVGHPATTENEEHHIISSKVRELAPVTWTVLSYDNFETGTWGNYRSGGREAKLEKRSFFDSLFTSKVSATVRDNVSPPNTASSFFHANFINVSAYDDLRLRFYYYSEGMRTGTHKFFIEYNTEDTSPWRSLEVISSFTDRVPLEKTVVFSSSSIDVLSMSKIKLRFRCQGKDRTTKVYVDNIRFDGMVVPPKTRSEATPDTICPIDRLYPPSVYEILPYSPPTINPNVQDDLAEISSLAFSDQTDAQGSLFAYTASDKNQFSIKVLMFTRHSQTGQVIMGSATTVATYALDVYFSNSDWEDISLGPCDGSQSAPTCIYVGDFGNNARPAPDPYVQRNVLRILKFQEPIFSGSTPRSLSKVPITTILYRYASPGWIPTRFYDAEAMFVDWVGAGKGDIYIVTKGTCTMGGVGKIPSTYHGKLPVENIPSSVYMTSDSYVYPMAREMVEPPKQGSTVRCNNSEFRHWQGADMRRDGRLIALITGASPPRVYFYPRVDGESVIDAFTSPMGVSASCPYIPSTSYGLLNEKRHEAVAFLPDGNGFADTSECDGGRRCKVPIYFWDLIFQDSSALPFPSSLVPVDGWQRISFETFESRTMGIFANGTNASTSRKFSCPSGGVASRWSAQISHHGGQASSIYHKADQNASNYSWLKVEFDFLLDGCDHMDAFFLELSLDSGQTFFMVADWALGTQGTVLLKTCYKTNTVVLKDSVFGRLKFGPNVRLRFRTSANAVDDRLYIDNIQLLGHS